MLTQQWSKLALTWAPTNPISTTGRTYNPAAWFPTSQWLATKPQQHSDFIHRDGWILPGFQQHGHCEIWRWTGKLKWVADILHVFNPSIKGANNQSNRYIDLRTFETLQVQHLQISRLFNLGATHFACSATTAAKLQQLGIKILPTTFPIRDVQGGLLNVTGKMLLPLKVQNKQGQIS
jgi:hypothetical protein